MGFICKQCYTGLAASNIVRRSVQSFEVFVSLIKETFSNRVINFSLLDRMCIMYFQGACEVERIVGITDYDSMFEGTVPANNIRGLFERDEQNYIIFAVTGLTSAAELRISALPDGSGIDVFYKFDVAKEGWHPAPAPLIPCPLWINLFAHPFSPVNQGFTII